MAFIVQSKGYPPSIVSLLDGKKAVPVPTPAPKAKAAPAKKAKKGVKK